MSPAVTPLIDSQRLGEEILASYADEIVGSPAAEERLALLTALHARADCLLRSVFIPSRASMTDLALVAAGAPNARRAAEVIYHAASLSAATGTGLRVPPIILHGPPGSGKTRFARRALTALGLPVEVVSCASMAETGHLCGYGLAWRNPAMGAVARALLAASTLGVGLVLDELDKCGTYVAGQDTRDGILPLLEPSTAREWVDDWLGVPMDAAGIVVVITCNDLAPFSEAFLDRCIVVDVPALDGAERETALAAMLEETVLEAGMPAQGLPRGAGTLLAGVPFRRARSALRLALGMAVTAGREEVDIDDVRRALAIVDGGERRGMGFVR